MLIGFVFFFQAEDGIRDLTVTGVQTCALPIYARRPCGGPRGGRVVRPPGSDHVVAVGAQPGHQPSPDEPVGAGDEHLHATRSRSASTISVTRARKSTRGAQPSSRFAFPRSAWSVSTSAGRTKRGSTLTNFFQSSPTCANATSHSSRTVCVSPVPTT